MTNANDSGNTDQKDKVDFDSMSAQELTSYVDKKKAEAIKLTAIVDRKGKKVESKEDLSNEDVTEEKTEELKKPISETERTDRLELKVDYGYPDEVINHIIGLGGKQALDNPITKKVADQMAKEVKNKQATDIPDGSNSSVDRKLKVSDLEGLSSEEMEKVLPHKEA